MEGKIKVTIGKYTCRCEYKIVGMTIRTKEDFNRLLAREDANNGWNLGKVACGTSKGF